MNRWICPGTCRGFALIEILIALSILSIILLSVFSSVSSGIYVMNGNRNATRAVIIAKSKLNEFILKEMRGADVQNEQVRGESGFVYSRKTEPFRHPLLGALPAFQTQVTVSWIERGRKKHYSVFYVYQGK